MAGRKDVGSKLLLQNATFLKPIQEPQDCEHKTLVNAGFTSKANGCNMIKLLLNYEPHVIGHES